MSAISLLSSPSATTSLVPAAPAKNTDTSGSTISSLELSPAYEQSQGLIDLIHASSSTQTASSMLRNLYSSSATLQDTAGLSDTELKKMQELNASSAVSGYTAQMKTLLSSLDTSSAVSNAAVTQNLLQADASANVLSLQLLYDPTGTLQKIKSGSANGQYVDLLA